MPSAFIGIGSNLGDRIRNCRNAIRAIKDIAGIKSISSIYETEPVGIEDQPDFINCVIRIETDLIPTDLLTKLLGIEKDLGRERSVIGGPRIIDLDILFYEDRVLEYGNLIIPHPRAHLRRFVLEPLNEIDPELVHPGLNASVSKLLNELEDEKIVKKIGEFSTYY
ncbi:MAG: 2-amino-4-hydroxy-6-hydroxymethyldihydropteridine diphosphokinase [Thermodesulfobacteriota bacterium]